MGKPMYGFLAKKIKKWFWKEWDFSFSFLTIFLGLVWLVATKPLTGPLAVVASQSGFGMTLYLKALVFIIAFSCLFIVLLFQHLWFKMVDAAPMAMLLLSLHRITVKAFKQLRSLISQYPIVRTTQSFARQRQFQTGVFALASLFNLSALPFRLFALSTSLIK
ncbi:MAG: hypothetical protein JXA42_12495 [Anaerolineales bacterium]|nr:hypothetical protein [Anaerolineales bacterium]